MAVSTAVSPLRSLGAAAKRPLFNSKAPTLARPRRQISARHGAQFESSCSPSLRKDGRNHNESIMNPKDSMFSLCLFKEHLTLQCRRNVAWCNSSRGRKHSKSCQCVLRVSCRSSLCKMAISLNKHVKKILMQSISTYKPPCSKTITRPQKAV